MDCTGINKVSDAKKGPLGPSCLGYIEDYTLSRHPTLLPSYLGFILGL